MKNISNKYRHISKFFIIKYKHLYNLPDPVLEEIYIIIITYSL